MDESRPALHSVTVNKCPILINSDFIISLYPDQEERNAFYKQANLDMKNIIDCYKFVKANKEALEKENSGHLL